MTALGVWLALATAAGAAPADAPLRYVSFGAYAERARAVVDGYSVRSTLGPAEVPLPRALADFMLDHLVLSGGLVRRRGIAPYRVEKRGPRAVWADDGAGTSGDIELVERGEAERVYYGEGVHRGLFLPPISAAAVVVMALSSAPAPGGCPRTRCYLHVYVRLNNPVISSVAKALRPLVRRIIMSKIQKALTAAERAGRLLGRDPGALEAADEPPSLSVRDRALLRRLVARARAVPSACAAGR